jgi:hypothetical protein
MAIGRVGGRGLPEIEFTLRYEFNHGLLDTLATASCPLVLPLRYSMPFYAVPSTCLFGRDEAATSIHFQLREKHPDRSSLFDVVYRWRLAIELPQAQGERSRSTSR